MATFGLTVISARSVSPLPCPFLGSPVTYRPLQCMQRRIFSNLSAARFTAWFKFGNRGLDAQGAGIYGSQHRDDFNRDDVEQYFNYMGMLATEGSYDKMEALLGQGTHPVDILLMMASSEGDKPKIEELLRAGADSTVKDPDGKTAVDRAKDEDIRQFIVNFKAPSTIN